MLLKIPLGMALSHTQKCVWHLAFLAQAALPPCCQMQ